MIKRLKLKNFQSHRRLDITFAGGITTIRGPTDSGKSAILRALRWVCLNDFAGDDFIREGSKVAEARLEVESGGKAFEIVRRKGAGENLYVLNGQEFKSFGQGVPDPIRKVLQLSGLNFQAQHDAPFWFAESPGEVSRQLNAVIDLSIIDLALSNAASEIRTAQERKNLCEERLEKAKETFRELDEQQARVDEFVELKELKERVDKFKDRGLRLGGFVVSIERNNADELWKKATQLEQGVLTLGRLAILRQRKWESLRNLIDKLETTQVHPPPDFSPVEEAFLEYSKLEQQVDGLRSFLRRIAEVGTAYNMRRASAEEIEQEFHKRIQGQRCPLCDNRLT